MNRLSTLILIGFAGLLASCGSSVSSSTQPKSNQVYSMVVTPTQFTLDAGTYASISAMVYLSTDNKPGKLVSDCTVANACIKLSSSDPGVTINSGNGDIEVCAGQWANGGLNCVPTSPLPAGYVTITAYNASHNVSGTTLVSVHKYPASITQSAPVGTGPGQYPPVTYCVSQNNSVQYTAAAVDTSGNPIPSCSVPIITPYSFALTSISVSSGVVTAKFSYTGTAPPLLVAGNVVTISGVTPSSYNGSFPLTSAVIDTSAMTITVEMKNSSASGIASVVGGIVGEITFSISSLAPGCVYNTDYTWTSSNKNVALVSATGNVTAVNPGVAIISANLNGTTPTLAFVTCPPTSIALSTSVYTGTTPIKPFSTADLDPPHALNKDSYEYVTATLTDTNGVTLHITPLTYITSDPLLGSFTPFLPLTTTLEALSPGRFTMMASCETPTCNPTDQGNNISTPAGVLVNSSQALGFGYPVYSNVIGVTVQGSAISRVLVTNSDQAPTARHDLMVYDSDSMTLIAVGALPTLPNSLVVAPNGATAYLGSNDISQGLMVVELNTSYNPLTPGTYPICEGSTCTSTQYVTGKVLGVSPDSRYVLVSDVANSLVFLIDTTGTKQAEEYPIPNITSVVFAPDGSNIWIGGASGVYEFQANTFVPISNFTSADAGLSTNVTSLAWTPDGQSYFASGDQLVNYSTCNDQKPQTVPGNPTSTVPQGLSTTALSGVPHLLGLDGTTWFDYPVTSTSQIPIQTGLGAPPLPPAGAKGNVCLSTVTVSTPVQVASTLPCTAQQITFSPTLEREFVTGVNPACATPDSFIHGYQVGNPTEFTLTAAKPIVPLSGGVLNDGRYLYVGSNDSTNGAVLHRFDLSTGTEDTSFCIDVEDSTPPDCSNVPAKYQLVPSFVAVVP